LSIENKIFNVISPIQSINTLSELEVNELIKQNNFHDKDKQSKCQDKQTLFQDKHNIFQDKSILNYESLKRLEQLDIKFQNQKTDRNSNKKVSCNKNENSDKKVNSDTIINEENPKQSYEIDKNDSLNCHNHHTKEVGTVTYSAPEQLNKTNYDQKADIYSLGIVLFELIYPIRTSMEKSLKLNELKKRHKVPDNFFKLYPKLSSLIIEMTNINPQNRPNCSEILTMIEIIKETELNMKGITNCNNITELAGLSYKKSNSVQIKENIIFTSSISITEINNNIINGRPRVLSEGFSHQSYPSYQLKMKISTEEMNVKQENNLKKVWVKIINDKLLIFNKNNSKKADIVYNLRESEVRYHKFNNRINNMFNNKGTRNNSQTKQFSNNKIQLFKLDTDNSTCNNDDTETPDSRKTFSSLNLLSFNSILTENNNENNNNNNCVNNELYYKYELDIEHPYLNNCQLLGDYSLHSKRFLEKIKLFCIGKMDEGRENKECSDRNEEKQIK